MIDADGNIINYKTEYLLDGRKQIFYEPTVVGMFMFCECSIEGIEWNSISLSRFCLAYTKLAINANPQSFFLRAHVIVYVVRKKA